MVNAQRYDMQGDYSFRGRKENQAGTLHFANNWALYGGISDSTANGISPKKVVGMHFIEDGAIGLLKISEQLTLYPIIWYMKPTDRVSQEGDLSGTYEGTWSIATGMPIEMIQTLASQSNRKCLEALAELGPTEFQMGIFNRSTLESLEKQALVVNQRGRMKFSRAS